MGIPQLLEAASLLVPEERATENDITVADVWEYLTHDEWEVALELLEELGDVRALPLTFWEALAIAAEQMRMEKSAARCRGRCHEARNGNPDHGTHGVPARSRPHPGCPAPGMTAVWLPWSGRSRLRAER